jgi:hypothetical protein
MHILYELDFSFKKIHEQVSQKISKNNTVLYYKELHIIHIYSFRGYVHKWKNCENQWSATTVDEACPGGDSRFAPINICS